jgi:hypothetical protein
MAMFAKMSCFSLSKNLCKLLSDPGPTLPKATALSPDDIKLQKVAVNNFLLAFSSREAVNCQLNAQLSTVVAND